MIRTSIFLAISLWTAACAAHDERYYVLHPKVLQKAIALCPSKHPADISCEQLKNMASHVNELAFQLRLNPQKYGQEILSLQEAIAKQESAARQVESASDLKIAMATNKHQLEERLAIVKWLESPGG